MSLKLRKKKKSLLISIQVFLKRYELVIGNERKKLNYVNIANILNCSPQLVQAIFHGERKSPQYVEKLIEMGFPIQAIILN